jgi:hypothetical protein
MWMSGASDDGPDEETFRRMTAPENELPVAVPLNRLLARTDDLAVALVGMQVYSTGLTFELAVRVRPSAVDTVGRGLQEMFWDHPPRRTADFLLGVELGDGRRVSNLAGNADGIVFHQGGGSGGDTAIDQSWWLSPLPPDGPLRFVVRCDPLGIPETVTELDGAAVRAATADVVTLWPWERPSAFREAPPPARPDVPPGSWFGRS